MCVQVTAAATTRLPSGDTSLVLDLGPLSPGWSMSLGVWTGGRPCLDILGERRSEKLCSHKTIIKLRIKSLITSFIVSKLNHTDKSRNEIE